MFLAQPRIFLLRSNGVLYNRKYFHLRSDYGCFRLAIHPRVSHVRGDDGGCRSFRLSRATSKGAQDPAALLYLRRRVFKVVGALSKHVRKLPATLRRSLTWDRGLEMAKHKDFTVATDVKVYFCDPQSPWQRGSNENTNGLLRQYFSKKTGLSDYSQSDLNKVALRLNQRPRETLGFQTPASKLQESVASTH